METKDPERYGKFFADNITLTFSNNPVIEGRESVLAAYASVLSVVELLRHELSNLYEEEDGTVIFEAKATWNMPDGSVRLTFAGAMFRIVDDKFVDQRIYVDMAPVTGSA
jgi:hypothetical protein